MPSYSRRDNRARTGACAKKLELQLAGSVCLGSTVGVWQPALRLGLRHTQFLSSDNSRLRLSEIPTGQSEHWKERTYPLGPPRAAKSCGLNGNNNRRP